MDLTSGSGSGGNSGGGSSGGPGGNSGGGSGGPTGGDGSGFKKSVRKENLAKLDRLLQPPFFFDRFPKFFGDLPDLIGGQPVKRDLLLEIFSCSESPNRVGLFLKHSNRFMRD